MGVRQGYLLISAISGYNRFLVESELGHAKEILDSLRKTTIEAIKAPVRVLNTRGDAVLAFVADDDFPSATDAARVDAGDLLRFQ